MVTPVVDDDDDCMRPLDVTFSLVQWTHEHWRTHNAMSKRLQSETVNTFDLLTLQTRGRDCLACMTTMTIRLHMDFIYTTSVFVGEEMAQLVTIELKYT